MITNHNIKIFASSILLSGTVFAYNIANAHDSSNTGKYYGSLTGEYIFSAESEDGDVSGGGMDRPRSLDYNNGWGGLAAIGYYYNDNMREEIEIGDRNISSDRKSTTVSGVPYRLDPSNNNLISAMGIMTLQHLLHLLHI